MGTRTMEVPPGSVIDRVIRQAIEEAGDDTIGFDFNGVTVTVDRRSDPDATYRKWRDTMDVNCKRLIAEKHRQEHPEQYWTSTAPTSPGWYWCRKVGEPRHFTCSVYHTPYGMAAASYNWVCANSGWANYEWAGPIAEPLGDPA